MSNSIIDHQQDTTDITRQFWQCISIPSKAKPFGRSGPELAMRLVQMRVYSSLSIATSTLAATQVGSVIRMGASTYERMS